MTIRSGRLSILAAAFVIARRDFGAVLFSRSFIFFLLGPLFPVLVGGMAGSIGNKVEQATNQAQLGIMMSSADAAAFTHAADILSPHLAGDMPPVVIVPDGPTTPAAALKQGAGHGNLGAILSGTLAHPLLTGTPERVAQWRGPVALVAARASGHGPDTIPEVALVATATSHADENHGRIMTAQGGQTLLFLLTMLLAGMVLSNLVEEKGNKIIEILAAAIPMDAVFLGKLFAMLAVSLVGISVWASAGLAIHVLGGSALPALTAPAVGWPVFLLLGVAYFAMAYLLLGSLFLAIGSLANTVREVQTLSMPVTMGQLMVFFFASYAMAHMGSPLETAAMIVPFSSPFAMLARAAVHGEIWPHLAALAWQALCVALFVRAGAAVFRKRVMQSGPARVKKGWFRKAA